MDIGMYKKKPLNFRDAVDNRQLRLHRKSLHQKEARGREVNQRRGLLHFEETEQATATKETATAGPRLPVLSRQEKLVRYKEEKLLRKKLEAERKKPAFVLQSKIKYGNPGFLHNLPEPVKPTRTGVVTRSMAKSGFVLCPSSKQTTASKIPKPKSGKTQKESVKKELTVVTKVGTTAVESSCQPIIGASTTTTSTNTAAAEGPQVVRKSFAPDNFQFKAPSNLTIFPFVSTETQTIADAKPIINSVVINEVTNQITECVQVSNASETSPAENEEIGAASASTITRTSEYYRDLVESTTLTLVELRDKWLDTIAACDEGQISENVTGQILSVTGQTNLLLNKKFKQFRGLISDCEKQAGEFQTKLDDLQGFWDMMYIQVEDLLAKYKKLEKIMSNNWVEVISPVKKLKTKIASKNGNPISKVRVNKAQEARQRVAKKKAAAYDSENVFSPCRSNNPEREGDENSQMETVKPYSDKNSFVEDVEKRQPLLRLTERMSFLQQIPTRENIVADKFNLANLFSPLKTEYDRYSTANKDNASNPLIRFSDVHSFANND